MSRDVSGKIRVIIALSLALLFAACGSTIKSREGTNWTSATRVAASEDAAKSGVRFNLCARGDVVPVPVNPWDVDYMFSYSAWLIPEDKTCSSLRAVDFSFDEVFLFNMRNGSTHLGGDHRRKMCKNESSCVKVIREGNKRGAACFSVRVKEAGAVIAEVHDVCGG